MNGGRAGAGGVIAAALCVATASASAELLEAGGGLPSPEACPVRECRPFAATALLEAAVRRQHGQVRGRPLALSEADLFLRRTLESPGRLEAAARALGGEGRLPEPHDLAGDGTQEDVRLLLAEGSVTRDNAPWSAVRRLYEDEKTREESDAAGREYDCRDALARHVSWESVSSCIPVVHDPQRRWRRVLDVLRGVRAESARRPDTGEAVLARQDREWTRRLFADFSVRAVSFRGRSEGTCGTEARRFVVEEVRAGRPVALRRAGPGTMVVSAASVDERGEAVALTLLGEAAPVPAARLCGVIEGVSVLARGER